MIVIYLNWIILLLLVHNVEVFLLELDFLFFLELIELNLVLALNEVLYEDKNSYAWN